MSKRLGAFQLFKPSKEAVLNNFASFLIIIFLPAFLILIGDAMNLRNTLATSEIGIWGSSSEPSPASMPYYIVGGILSLVLLPAGFYLELMAAKAKTISASEAVKSSKKYFLRVIGLTLITGLIILAGLVALIIPGIIFIRRYFLAPYFLVDKDMGIQEAMSASAAATKGRPGAIWGVIGLMVLLSLFNIIPVLGGLISLILLTLYTCAPAMRYLELRASPIK